MANSNPLVAPPPQEVYLPEAPLVRVLAQVRFPPVLSVRESSFVAPFQESIRDAYPILRQEKIRNFVFSQQGIDADHSVVWRFTNTDHNWRVSLAVNFVALETTAYLSRSDFLERFRKILASLNEHVNPQIVERLGLRYIARLEQNDVDNLSALVRPEVLGIVPIFGVSMQQTVSESVFSLPEERGQMRARWGRLPPNTTIDPSVIEPIDELSWVLDLDLSITKERTFDLEQILNETSFFSERQYAFFRWTVTDDFLRRFGGKI